MAVIDEIKLRFGTETLVQLTNHNEDRTATTINDIRLQKAIDDAAADFQVKTGFAFQGDVAEHLAIICNGTIFKLQFYKDFDSSLTSSLGRDFYGALASLARRKSMLFRNMTDADARQAENPCDRPFRRDLKVFNARRR